jgi:hypothetical protein
MTEKYMLFRMDAAVYTIRSVQFNRLFIWFSDEQHLGYWLLNHCIPIVGFFYTQYDGWCLLGGPTTSVKFCTCTVVSVNGTVVEDKMRRFGLNVHIFNKCPIYTHDGASAKFSIISHETDNSAV